MKVFLHKESRIIFWARHLVHHIVRLVSSRNNYKICTFSSDLIGREVAVAGIYEASGISAVKWLVDNSVIDQASNSVFLDVGANIGVYTIACALLFKRVESFEPHPVVRQVLALNKAINHFDNVTIHAMGLSDKDGVATLYEGFSDNMGASSLERGAEANTSYQVELRNASTAILQVTQEPVAFIKVDVEGHEAKVFQGLSLFLSKQQPVIAFEANDPVHNQALMNSLKEYGYKTFLALDYSPSIRWLGLRVLILTILGVKTRLKEVATLQNKQYSLVFALPEKAAKKWRSL